MSFETYVASVCKTEAEREAMTRVTLGPSDFKAAKVRPSVSLGELQQYDELRAKFSFA